MATKEISRHVINRKANAKLNYVVKVYEAALGSKYAGVADGFLNKKLFLQDLRFLNELCVKYKIENRFFAMSFDLNYESKVELETDIEDVMEENNCAFAVKLKGVASISGAEFVDRGSECEGQAIVEYLSQLNHKLIIDRIIALDLTDIKVTYRADIATWSVSCRSLIGSTTWNLIPPVLQLITPKREECVKLIEFFELVFNAVIRRNKC